MRNLKLALESPRTRELIPGVALMKRSAEWWNANTATPGKRIVRMETHHKQWDFVKERDDNVNDNR